MTQSYRIKFLMTGDVQIFASDEDSAITEFWNRRSLLSRYLYPPDGSTTDIIEVCLTENS